jgi:hypothetical protein
MLRVGTLRSLITATCIGRHLGRRFTEYPAASYWRHTVSNYPRCRGVINGLRSVYRNTTMSRTGVRQGSALHPLTIILLGTARLVQCLCCKPVLHHPCSAPRTFFGIDKAKHNLILPEEHQLEFPVKRVTVTVTITLARLGNFSRRILHSYPSLSGSASVWSGTQADTERCAGEMTSTTPKPEKSYLSAAVDSISPWTASRSSTPKARGRSESGPRVQSQQGGDHSFNYRHGLSLRKYPKDCPPANIRWFYAVDVRLISPSHVAIDCCRNYNFSLTNLQRRDL